MRKVFKKNNQKGFTLIELVVAIAIMLLMGAAVTPMLLSHLKDAKVATVNETLLAIKTAFDSYYTKAEGVPNDSDSDSDYLDEVVDAGFLPRTPEILKKTPTLERGDVTYDHDSDPLTPDITTGEEYTINVTGLDANEIELVKSLDERVDGVDTDGAGGAAGVVQYDETAGTMTYSVVKILV